ncbi:MAG: heme ABC transporter ATP-binding protein [Clostridia bacterium]|nr:heme ABC transporter ATP-binding protein [Clostridia bacterium]
MNIIDVKNITYSYGGNTNAIDNISLAVEKGEIVTIIGPNGSGKSTILKCISGYLKPQIGEISVNNKSIREYSAKEIAQTMALMQQHFSLDYDFTVMQIVLMGRNPHIKRMQGETQQDYDIANDSLKKAGIFHLKNRSITSLSGGEWQRMILARALCQQSAIMLLDEPVSGLDIKHQINLMSITAKLSRENNISVVCVLHDLNLANNYSDRIILLKEGRIYKSGTPAEMMTKENLEYVYDTPINIINYNETTIITPEIISE